MFPEQSFSFDLVVFAFAILVYLLYGAYVFFFQDNILSTLSVEYPVSLKGSALNLAAQDGIQACATSVTGNSDNYSKKKCFLSSSCTKDDTQKVGTQTGTTSSANSGNLPPWTVRHRNAWPNTERTG